MRHPLPVFVLPVTLSLLTACGGSGGGGGGGTTLTPPVASEPVWLVFSADKRVDERHELYATLSDDSIAPINLSDNAEPLQVESFALSADGQWVAFTARADEDASGAIDAADGPFDLYWTRVDGTAAPARISGELPAHAGINYFQWSPVDNSLVFNADIDTDDVDEIYIVTQATPAAVRINGSVGSSAEMGEVRWSPDGRYIAQIVRNRSNRYITDRVAINVYDTAAGGPNSTRVTGTTLPGATIGATVTGRHIDGTVIWAPDASRLAYLIRDWDAGTRIHYQAFPDGRFERVTAPLNPNESGFFAMAFSSDSRYLAYTISTDGIGTNKLDVYDTATSLPHRVITVPGGGVITGGEDMVQWRPGTYELALFASASATAPIELYLLTGNAVNSTLPAPVSAPGAGESFASWSWSPDGRYFGYVERGSSDSTLELVTIEPDNGDLRATVSHASDSTTLSLAFGWMTGNRILYSFGNGVHVAVAGQARSGSAIHGGLDADIGLPGAERTVARANERVSDPDEQTIGFLALRPGTDVQALYHVRPNGSGRVDLTGAMIAGGDVKAFAFGAEENP